MNAFDDRFRDAQGKVPSLTGVSSSDQKNAGFLFKKITDVGNDRRFFGNVGAPSVRVSEISVGGA